MARALLKKREADAVDLTVNGVARRYVISSIRYDG